MTNGALCVIVVLLQIHNNDVVLRKQFFLRKNLCGFEGICCSTTKQSCGSFEMLVTFRYTLSCTQQMSSKLWWSELGYQIYTGCRGSSFAIVHATKIQFFTKSFCNKAYSFLRDSAIQPISKIILKNILLVLYSTTTNSRKRAFQ